MAPRDVLDVTAQRRASDGRVAGSWTSRLDPGQASPYLGDLAPPEFAMDGKGTFDIDPVAGTVAIRSRLEASASQWDRLDPRLASIGALRIDADIAADVAFPRVDVHSLSARLLRREAERLGFSRDFTIYDEDDRLALVMRLMEGRDLSTKLFPPQAVQAIISNAKNRMQGPDALRASAPHDPLTQVAADLMAAMAAALRPVTGSHNSGDLPVTRNVTSVCLSSGPWLLKK